jgi:hypothetical protein
MPRLFRETPRATVVVSAVAILFGSSLFASAQAASPGQSQTQGPTLPPGPANPPSPTAGNGAFRVGGVDVNLPSPDKGMSEVGPDYRVVFDVMVPDTNRLVAAYVSQDDMPVVHGASQANLTRYAAVEVLRQAEFATVSQDDFKAVVEQVAQQIGSNLQTSINSGDEEFNRKLKALNPDAPNIAIDKPVPLGTLFNKTDAYGYGLILPVSSKGQTTRMVGGVAIVRAANRILFCYDFAVFKDEDSAKAIRANSEAWADAILAANKGS